MHYKYIDVAKGIGMLLVLLAHSCGFIYYTGLYCISFFMPLFFVLAGYVYKNKYSFREYLKKKAQRVLKPYFIDSIILLIICYTLGICKNNIFNSIIGIFYSSYCLFFPRNSENNIFFFVLNNEPMWFLTTFFVASIFFYIVINGWEKVYIKYILIAIIAHVVTFLPIYLPWGADIAILGLIFMLIGYHLKTFIEPEKRKIFEIIFLIFVYILLANLNPNVNMSTREYGDFLIGNTYVYILTGTIGSIICIYFSKIIQNTFVGTIMSLIGKNTVPILAFHLILFRIFDTILSDFYKKKIEGNVILYWVWGYFKIFIIVFGIIVIKYLLNKLTRVIVYYIKRRHN